MVELLKALAGAASARLLNPLHVHVLLWCASAASGLHLVGSRPSRGSRTAAVARALSMPVSRLHAERRLDLI